MKKTDKTLKRLAAYSTAAAAVLAVTPQAQAELVGYDMNPDSNITFPQDTATQLWMYINMNNVGPVCDNIEEFFIEVWTAGSSSLAVWGSAYYGAGLLGNWNPYYYTGIVKTNVIDTAYGGTITSTYTGTNTNFWPTVAVGSSSSSVGAFNSEDNWLEGQYFSWVWYYSGTNWGSWSGKSNKYTGVRFNAFTMDTVSTPGDTLWEANHHYGWIYMDVGTNGSAFTIKAWAYETTPGASVVYDMDAVNWNPVTPNWCSDTLVYPSDELLEESVKPPYVLPDGIIENNLDGKVSIYSYDRNARVSLDGIRAKGNISVYNVSGQKIQEQPIKGNSNLVNIKGSARGLFVVKVDVDGEGTRSQKVYIN